jgi:hypothetical protein
VVAMSRKRGDAWAPTLFPNPAKGLMHDRFGQVADFCRRGARDRGTRGAPAGACASAAGADAGGLSVSRKEYDGVFSVGDITGRERGAFDFVVFGEPLAAVDPEGLTFEDVFVSIQGDLFWLLWQEDIDAAGRVARDADLAETDRAATEVGEYGNGHGEVLVDFALGYGHVKLHFASFPRRRLIFEVIARHLSSVDPLVEKPVEAAIALQVHGFCHMSFGDRLE